jgi:hypothetical protein
VPAAAERRTPTVFRSTLCTKQHIASQCHGGRCTIVRSAAVAACDHQTPPKFQGSKRAHPFDARDSTYGLSLGLSAKNACRPKFTPPHQHHSTSTSTSTSTCHHTAPPRHILQRCAPPHRTIGPHALSRCATRLPLRGAVAPATAPVCPHSHHSLRIAMRVDAAPHARWPLFVPNSNAVTVCPALSLCT